MQRGIIKVVTATIAVAAVVGLAACAPTASTGTSSTSAGAATADPVKQYANAQEVIDSYPTTDYCGTKDLSLAFPAGIVNAWMKQSYYMIQQEAAKCPNIKNLQIVDAGVDQQKAVSDVNSLVAQGVNGIVTLPIFGAAQVPSFKAAMKAGVPVVTFVSDSGGVVGTDVAAQVDQDIPALGQAWADYLGKNLKTGSVVFLGNAPGQPSSQAAFDAFKTALAAYPGLTLVEPEFVPTNNSAVTKKQQMTAMLAKHGRIDAVVSDNGAIDSSVIDAYQEAGMALPYIANDNTTNGLNCVWQKTNFPLFSLDGSNVAGVVGFRHLLAAVNNIPTTEPTVVKQFISADTLGTVPAKCDPSVSPDADWSTGLTADQFKQILG
ncbi:MAG: ribose transporter substrate-binding protein [Subtercola sp.]|nr:ribose transporter substrate-binding protein [Subtercola sp.]